MRMYRSARVARYHPAWRPYGEPPPPPTYQVVQCYPPSMEPRNRIAIVGENPGADEDQAGFPFVGRSGEELDRFLDTYGIDPDACLITNIGRIYNIGNNDPTEDEVATWEPLLKEELNAARPYWIAAVGRVSTRYFLGDVDMEAVHGVPFMVILPWLDNGRGGRVVIIPIYHPAAGFHSTELQAAIAYDFAQLEATVNGRLTPRNPETADRFPDPDYRDLTDSPTDLRLIQEMLSGGTVAAPLKVAIDTEGLPGKPWGLSASIKDGEAINIRKVHPAAIAIFRDALLRGIAEGRIKVTLHNSLHDLRVLRELGIRLPDGSFTDTMVLSYHLCIEPQGLKALAYRHAGMEMSSYDEITQDAQDKIAVEYYELMEALCAGGVEYATPESKMYRFKAKTLTPPEGIEAAPVEWITMEFDSEVERDTILNEFKAAGHKTSKLQPRTVPPSDPVSIGPFPYLHPFEVQVRDPESGQLILKTKKVMQIDSRVNRALAEFRGGKITAAQLRDRWNGTDDLICDSVEEVIGPMREADLDDVPLPIAVNYACRDADATHRIEPILAERHTAMNLTYIGKIDHDIIPMVDRMQEEGIPVDIPYLRQLSLDLKREMAEVQAKIKAEFGVWINPNSGEQVADLLFSPVEEGGYGLVASKKTKGRTDKKTGETVGRRGSTVDKVIEGLKGEVEKDGPVFRLLNYITEYRGLLKAKTSFCDVAIRLAVKGADGVYRVHCRFRITRVSSGRLSATNPNLLAVMGGELGNRIRKGYIAGDGYEFVEWDLNQIEMRVMASEANDAFLLDMFIRDEDVHTGTADKMFKLNLTRPYNKKQVNKEKHRDPAKRTGFGIITGIQPPGLVDQMRLQGIIVTEDEAAKWIVDWLAACPSVPEYMQACHREAMAYGYVRDWAGRIRYLPGIHSPFRHIRAEAGRQSHSHKIQAGAQSIMKIGMDNIWRGVLPYWREVEKVDIQPILQVHDALMFRRQKVTREQDAEMDGQIRAALFSAAPPGFKLPLDAGGGSADTWGDLEH